MQIETIIILTVKIQTMNIKQKVMREREPEQQNNRYQLQNKNYESTPSLLKARQHINRNKENNNVLNQHNFNKQQSKPYHFDVIKSSEFPKRLKTSVNEHQFAHLRDKKSQNSSQQMRSSQQFFKFRSKQPTERRQNAYGAEHMTFGDVNQRRGLVTSREFIEQKRFKNQVIDQIISNTKRGLCKSFNEFTLGTDHCVNHPNKKAKYRLISELGEGEQQMFYCSKCAINLLQQNFKIEQINNGQNQPFSNSSRLQTISKLQLKLKNVEQRAIFEMDKNDNKEQLQMIQDQITSSNSKFSLVIEMMEKMRIEWMQKMNDVYAKKENEQRKRRDILNQIMIDLKSIQQEMKEYKNMKKFTLMKENQFQFITTSLTNKINKFDEHMQAIKPPSPCQQLEQQTFNQIQILDKLREELMIRLQTQGQRRQRQITFSRKSNVKQTVSQDQFACDELKRPFRVLFPSDELEQSHALENQQAQTNKMLSSVKERPTFGQLA